MKRFMRRSLSLALICVLLISLIGCSKKDKEVKTTGDNTTTPTTAQKETAPNEPTEIDRSKTITLDVFSSQTNYQGIQSGWFGKIIKDKFNIELNIIAPNVAGGGDTLYQTRSAEGNLGDIIIIDRARMKDCVESDIILDLTDYYANSTYLKTYDQSIQATRDFLGTDKIYALSGSSTCKATEPVFENQSPYVGTFMRLDYYNELGNPVIKDTADMLKVLKQMQDAHPTTEDGKKVYAFSLFDDWDGDYMTLASKYAFLYGYDEGKAGLIFPNPDATSYSEVVADDGVYFKALQMLFDANQMGLVDPDSSSQNWDTVYTKMQNGQTLFSFWPWLATSFNKLENREAGKGMAFIPVQDQKLVNDGYNRYGNTQLSIAIGSKTKYPERVFEFVDWMASSEYIYYTPGSAGIKGVNWDIVNGRPELTDLGFQCMNDGATLMPEEYGGGTYEDGRPEIGFNFLAPTSVDPDTGEKFSIADWSSVLESTKTLLDENYEKTFGAKNAAEYLLNNNLVQVAPGSAYFAPSEDTELSTKRSQCGDLITNVSWQMVFADNADTFKALWTDMKVQLEGLGYADVLAADLEKLDGLRVARAEAIKAESK
ncbi:MAG: transporter substrate-binding protein [Anaerocolumna sp.]|jgi:multiple sugar transport system substrate-binding protein/putative aldouronate transport system substrate-binding protein|nr:transporter substrate-binding protein [Anaerocolumna sp.]